MALFPFIITVLVVCAVVSAVNFFTVPVLPSYKVSGKDKPLISVLIPARNEERNLSRSLDSLNSSDYPEIEVIVYDDLSSDRTYDIASEYSHKGMPLKVIKGGEKPSGWTGKNYACHEMARLSSGEKLLFMDADVELSGGCLGNAVKISDRAGLDLLSCFPTQKMMTWGERILVPVMNLILLSLLPLFLVSRSRMPSLAAANGQFMFFSRDAYFDSGGHEALKRDQVEDIAFARRLKAKGYKVMTLLGGHQVFCRMYTGLSDSFEGFKKNFFPGSGMPAAVFCFFIGILFLSYTFPLIMVFSDPGYIPAVLMILCIRVLISLVSRQSCGFNVLLHPLQMVSMLIVGIFSVQASLGGNIYWKGRRLG